MVRSGLVAAVLLAGCYSPAGEPSCSVRCSGEACPIGLSCGTDGFCYRGTQCDQRPDASTDTDLGDGDGCPGLGFVHFCPSPVAPLRMFGVESIDTTNPTHCTEMKVLVGGELACVIAATTMTVTAKLSVAGANPLVLVGVEKLTIEVGGQIDVSAARDLIDCGTPPNGSDQGGTDDGAAGGAGGTLAAVGGGGGARTSLVAKTPPNPVVPFDTHLRGGCPGGAGGRSLASAGGGTGGLGGGAIYLLSGTSIELHGQILAQGTGGSGASGPPGLPGGGGGGGSGGMIILDAPKITLAASGVLLAAGGGGGAGGRGGQTVMPTQNGATATATAPNGGNPNNCQECGAGGGGAFATSLAADGKTTTGANAGGGGGGGGAGLIRYFTSGLTDDGARVRPPAT